MIAEWSTNCVFLAAMLESRHPELFEGLRQTLMAHGVEVCLLRNVRDVWAVDYSPVQVTERTLVKFTYAPDYLRGHENLITGDGEVRSFRDVGQCRRFYDAAGVINGESKVGRLRKPFHGREPALCRARQGELVQFLHRGELQIGIVAGLPLSPTEVAGFQQSWEVLGEEDCYLVLMGEDDHAHLRECGVFRPAGHIDTQTRELLMSRFQGNGTVRER